MIFIIINKSLFLGVGIKYNSSSLPPTTHTERELFQEFMVTFGSNLL